jgi:hypothetical protein
VHFQEAGAAHVVEVENAEVLEGRWRKHEKALEGIPRGHGRRDGDVPLDEARSDRSRLMTIAQ